MSARNYNYSLRDNAEERSSQPLYVYVLQVLTIPEKTLYTWEKSAHCIYWINVYGFHSCTVHPDVIKVFYLPTDAQ
jgi:hypothetical protein